MDLSKEEELRSVPTLSLKRTKSHEDVANTYMANTTSAFEICSHPLDTSWPHRLLSPDSAGRKVFEIWLNGLEDVLDRKRGYMPTFVDLVQHLHVPVEEAIQRPPAALPPVNDCTEQSWTAAVAAQADLWTSEDQQGIAFAKLRVNRVAPSSRVRDLMKIHDFGAIRLKRVVFPEGPKVAIEDVHEEFVLAVLAGPTVNIAAEEITRAIASLAEMGVLNPDGTPKSAPDPDLKYANEEEEVPKGAQVEIKERAQAWQDLELVLEFWLQHVEKFGMIAVGKGVRFYELVSQVDEDISGVGGGARKEKLVGIADEGREWDIESQCGSVTKWLKYVRDHV